MKSNVLKSITLTAFTAVALCAQTHTPPDPATVVARRVAYLTTVLTLTTAQQTQATTIFTNALNAETNLQTSLQTARTAIQTAIPKNDTATIDAQAATVGNLQGQLTDISSKAEAAFYQTLTADQQTKYNALHANGPGGFGGAGGHPGRFGGARR